MFPVTITLHSQEQLNAVLAALNGGTPPAAVVTAAEVREYADKNEVPLMEAKAALQKEKAKAPPKEPPSSEQTQRSSDSSESSSSESTEQTDQASVLAYDDVKGPFLAYIKDHGRDAATKLLGKFGAAKLPDVDPSKYAEVLAAIKGD